MAAIAHMAAIVHKGFGRDSHNGLPLGVKTRSEFRPNYREATKDRIDTGFIRYIGKNT